MNNCPQDLLLSFFLSSLTNQLSGLGCGGSMGGILLMVGGVGAWSRWARVSKTLLSKSIGSESSEFAGFGDLVKTLSASCEGSSAAILLPCTSSQSSVNEFFVDLWMLRCNRRCSHAYSKVASGVYLKPLPQLCRLPPLRRIQISRRLSKGSEPKTKTPAKFSGDKTQDPWCQKRKVRYGIKKKWSPSTSNIKCVTPVKQPESLHN